MRQSHDAFVLSNQVCMLMLHMEAPLTAPRLLRPQHGLAAAVSAVVYFWTNIKTDVDSRLLKNKRLNVELLVVGAESIQIRSLSSTAARPAEERRLSQTR